MNTRMGTFWTWRSLGAMLLVWALVAAACGGDDGDDPEANAAAAHVENGAVLIAASSPGTLSVNGPQRVMLALVGQGPNDYFGADGETAVFEFTSPDESTSNRVSGDFLSTNGVSLGLFVAEASFDVAGRWDVTVAGTDALGGRTQIDVVEESAVPEAGDPAPLTASPVAADLDEARSISSDLDPRLEFYELSIADAVANDRPTLIAFATPAFCQTALCGPTMETVKTVVDGRENLDVVHVEPYDLPSAQAGTLVPLPIMFEWGLVSEPWIFVVDDDGTIAKGFEGTIGADELRAALDQVGA